MSTVIDEPCAFGSVGEQAVEGDVRTRIWQLLGALYPRGNLVERRIDHRYPYPYLIYLTPVGDDGTTASGCPVVVVGKHLSEHGLGFYHPKPLPYRRMIASLEAAGGSQLHFLVDLTWCRFTRHGWYESGGHFLRAVSGPDAIAPVK